MKRRSRASRQHATRTANRTASYTRTHPPRAAQVRQATVELELERDGVIVQRVRQSLPQREFTPQELVAYAIASGVFEEPTFYGALDLAVGVDDEEEAYRLVAVLRRS